MHNTTINTTTKVSPFALMFGREPIQPYHTSMLVGPEPKKSRTIEKIKRASELINQVADKNRTKMRAVQKNAYDKRNPKGKELKIGDIVMLKTFRQPVKTAEQKMRAQFNGPYRIITDPKRGAVWLENTEGKHLGPHNLEFLKRSNKQFVGKRETSKAPPGEL
jgi:hypothetical protein